jgi:alkylated DNA repair dioxygenase AlkB
MDGADVFYYTAIDLGAPSAAILAELIAQTSWRQDSITLFGQSHPQPRLHAWVGDDGCNYCYSGLSLDPLPWTPLLNDLRARVEAIACHRFNSVLLNYYRNGADSMGLHADDEPELGPRPVIASLSLGQQRKLQFKSRHDQNARTVHVPLGDSSLLIMAGDTQANWKHAIAKSRRPMGPRINLTFRTIRLSRQAEGRAL